MNTIAYHVAREPWTLWSEFNRMVERAAGANDAEGADWTPPVDIAEHADKYVLTADVPGVDPSAIEITLDQGVLTLSGARELEVRTEGAETRRTERAAGKFLRRFSLPDTVDATAVSASGKHGVLQVVIPKRPQSQPRRITVNA